MSFSQMIFDFEAMRWIATTCIGIYAWLIGRQSASAKEMLELRTRLTTLEVEMKQMPSHAQHNELLTKVERVGGEVNAVMARLEPLARSMDRVETFLLTTSK